jgi:hypothetical protein
VQAMTEIATPVARRTSADADGTSLFTPPTIAAPQCSVSALELQVSQLSVEHRRLSALLQAVTARQAAVQAQLHESTAALRDALRANSDAAAAASRRRVWPAGSSPDEVSVVLGKQLRPLQRKAILGVLDGFDTWLILPAGAGKTHPMHVIAAMNPGSLSLVVSPLLALAREQCASVHEAMGEWAQVVGASRKTAYVLGGTNQFDFDDTIGCASLVVSPRPPSLRTFREKHSQAKLSTHPTPTSPVTTSTHPAPAHATKPPTPPSQAAVPGRRARRSSRGDAPG